jgi:hypothetical protein
VNGICLLLITDCPFVIFISFDTIVIKAALRVHNWSVSPAFHMHTSLTDFDIYIYVKLDIQWIDRGLTDLQDEFVRIVSMVTRPLLVPLQALGI